MIATSALLGNAETYVHMTRTIAWTTLEYEQWRYRTWWHLATTPGPPPTVRVSRATVTGDRDAGGRT